MTHRYSRGFFELQVRFATLVGPRLGLTLAESLGRFTTIPLSLELGDKTVAAEFDARLAREDPLDATWSLYEHRYPDERVEFGSEWQGHRLFGCFYYVLRDETILRLHFIKNAPREETVLGRESESRRRTELAAMFRNVRESDSQAETVQGNSWLYNLNAYRRLFPPAYTEAMEETPYDEFHYLALWGQFYDRDWEPKAGPAAALLGKAERVRSAEDVLECFPLKVLRPQCGVEEFFRFYDVDD